MCEARLDAAERRCKETNQALAEAMLEMRSACTDAERGLVAEFDRVRAEAAEANRRNELLLEQMRTQAAHEQARAVHARVAEVAQVREEAREALRRSGQLVDQVRAAAEHERAVAIREARSTAAAEAAAARAADVARQCAEAAHAQDAAVLVARARVGAEPAQEQARRDPRDLNETPESKTGIDAPTATPDARQALRAWARHAIGTRRMVGGGLSGQ